LLPVFDLVSSAGVRDLFDLLPHALILLMDELEVLVRQVRIAIHFEVTAILTKV